MTEYEKGYHANAHCCYYATVEEFLKESKKSWLACMENQFLHVYKGMQSGDGEKGSDGSWSDTFDKLRGDILTSINDKTGTYIIFEYKLPEEGGRRPDVLLINKKQICVLEFKRKNNADYSDIDQTLGYAWDLENCHEVPWRKTENEKMEIKPYLVLTRVNKKNKDYKVEKKGISIVAPESLILPDFASDQGLSEMEIEKWLESKYSLQPGMLASLQRIKDEARKEHPEYFGNENEKIIEAVECLRSLRDHAKEHKKIIFVCVTGVTGAGKTLLGVNFLYENVLVAKESAVYITANDALVDVLSAYLSDEKMFANPIIKRLVKYRTEEKISENIIIIDEGQRIQGEDSRKYNAQRKRKYIYQKDIVNKINKKDWALLLLICAKRQVITFGGHEGIANWLDEIQKVDLEHKKWEAVSPAIFQKQLEKYKKIPHCVNDKLDLKKCLRTIKWKGLPAFIDMLLDNDLKGAKECLERMNEGDEYKLYITRDLKIAKKYCEKRYKDQRVKHYGIVCSSKGNLCKLATLRSLTKNQRRGWDVMDYIEIDSEWCEKCYEKWYVNGGSAEWSYVANELECQGLELDMAIVHWNNDLCWYLKNMTKEIYRIYMKHSSVSVLPVKQGEYIDFALDWSSDIVESGKVSDSDTAFEFFSCDDDQTIYRKYDKTLCNRIIFGMDTRMRIKYQNEKGNYIAWYSTDFQEWIIRYPQNNKAKYFYKQKFEETVEKRNNEKILLIRNIYRVLLTRGRDGMIIYVPNKEEYNDTYTVLMALGIKKLSAAME